MINIDTRLLDQVDEKELWLLLHLAKRFDSQKKCFPSNAVICKDAGWSLNTLQRVKQRLVDKGILNVTPRIDSSNIYTLQSDYLGVFVSLKGGCLKTGTPTQNLGTPLPKNGVPPLPKNGVPNLLTNEVLTNKRGNTPDFSERIGHVQNNFMGESVKAQSLPDKKKALLITWLDHLFQSKKQLRSALSFDALVNLFHDNSLKVCEAATKKAITKGAVSIDWAFEELQPKKEGMQYVPASKHIG